MKRRVVRVPAGTAVASTGECQVLEQQDGTLVATFTGVLLVDGHEQPSPAQLRDLWRNTAVMAFQVADATYRPNDRMQIDDQVRMAAFNIVAATLEKAQNAGYGNDRVSEIIQGIRESAGKAAAGITDQRQLRRLEATDQLMEQMRADWDRSCALDWIADDQ